MAANSKSVVREISKAAAARDEASRLDTIKVGDNRKAKVSKEDTTSVLGQIRFCLKPENRFAMAWAALLATIVPLSAYWLSHFEVPADYAAGTTWKVIIKLIFVLGALTFSALTVFEWSKRMTKDTRKAIAYTVLVEGAMLASDTNWLGWYTLGLIITINVVAYGVNLILGQKVIQE